MSATNRGAKRVENDFYGTPRWATEAILKRLLERGLEQGTVLEPGCGTGAIIRSLVEMGWNPHKILGIELDAERADKAYGFGRIEQKDFLAQGGYSTSGIVPGSKYDLVIGNPPYSLALPFVQKSLALTDHCVVMLLRLGWAEAKCRAAFHKNYPGHLHVLTKRPSFGLNKHGKKGTDATAYAWWQWGGPGYVPGKWEILYVE